MRNTDLCTSLPLVLFCLFILFALLGFSSPLSFCFYFVLLGYKFLAVENTLSFLFADSEIF